MENTSKPTIAGILIIIAGALEVLGSIGVFIASTMIGVMPGMPAGQIPPFLPPLLAGVGVIVLIAAVISIVGGVYTLKRKIWGLGLAGAILPIFFGGLLGLALGIAGIVLLALSKKEFA